MRRRYQVWFFYYPTSLPVVYSAMLLREDLDRFIQQLDPRGVHPALHRAVLVGHSMGGLLCRLAISDGGDRYYHHFFRQPLDELNLTSEQRVLARQSVLLPCADPNVSRVVFIATPHRGSQLASNVLGRMARLLVRMPQAVRSRVYAIVSQNRRALAVGAPIRSYVQPRFARSARSAGGRNQRCPHAVGSAVAFHSWGTADGAARWNGRATGWSPTKARTCPKPTASASCPPDIPARSSPRRPPTN